MGNFALEMLRFRFHIFFWFLEQELRVDLDIFHKLLFISLGKYFTATLNSSNVKLIHKCQTDGSVTELASRPGLNQES